MKKTLQFLFALSIMLEGGSAFAGTNETTSSSDKNAPATPVVSPMIKGQVVVAITVLDVSNDPIQGAEVAAPCTGQPPAYTNASGVATFTVSTCNCNDKPAHITTPQGCAVNINLVCGTGNIANCNNQD